ncbi:hypothetical protein [Rehaibacterium terrae]|jgi:hypothetical protein|uniref:Lipoprotein n=1 Tax=Rehaibacterium terrae TaxID=1341696 RepID=A0A7W7Y0V5_9GAMM|nr:hypothetical protein [Rehaibacterium terrae]MBB5016025.1 hypothetical protein [Rehaibacterium terrae]
MQLILHRAALAAFLLVSVASLTGCVTMPESRAFNAAANPEIKRIAVLPMRESEIDLLIVNNPGYSFGLVGAAIAEANRVPKRNWLREQVTARNFDHIEVFQQAFTEAMARRGFELVWPGQVVENGAKAKRSATGLRKAYTPIDDADAQLDLNFGFVGYAAAGSSDGAPYRPTAIVFAQLVTKDGKQVLFSDHVVYNNVFPGNSAGIVLNPDPTHRYPDFDDMKAAGPMTVDGLRLAFETVAETLAKQFGSVQ